MTHPSSPQAPMTLPERLRAIRFSSNPDDYDAITIEAAAEIDALTARVAELERQVVDWTVRTGRQVERADKAEAELAAARKVEDGEVEKRLKSLAAMHHHLGYSHTLDHVDRENIKKAMDLLTRLSAALKEAERPPEDGELYRKIQDVLDRHSAWIARPSNDVTKAIAIVAGVWGSRYADAAEARAQAAEAKLESARRDALEEAALELDRHPDANGSRYIRALQDTRHD